MSDEFIQAPWVITEQVSDSTYLLVQNNLNRKRWKLNKEKYGSPLGANVGPNIRAFLEAEKLIVRLDDIMPILENDFQYLRYGMRNNEQIATFIPTHACHFGCPYCYNQNLRNPNNESRLPPKTIYEKLINYYLISPAHKWTLNIIGGGEPLLAAKYICEIGRDLRKHAKKEGKIFEIGMVTNGHLLNNNNVSNLQDAGLKKVRVTLDPDHDKSRPLKNGDPTFETIITNLESLPDDIEIQIGSNVPFGKEASFKRLLENLAPLKERIKDFTVSLIMKPLKDNGKARKATTSRMYTKKEVDYLLVLLKAIDENGYKRKNHYPQIECEAGRLCEKLVMNMLGDTTCCAGLDGLNEYQTDFEDGVVKGSMDYRVINDESWKEFCFKSGKPCAYLPLCHTGCRLISISKGLDWWTINCEKMYLDGLTRYELREWDSSAH